MCRIDYCEENFIFKIDYLRLNVFILRRSSNYPGYAPLNQMRYGVGIGCGLFQLQFLSERIQEIYQSSQKTGRRMKLDHVS
jgi:hypothetical protein